MLEWKCCFRTRVVRRLNDSFTVIVCLCVLFLRDHLESLIVMWLWLNEIPNESFAGLTDQSSLQRSQSGRLWRGWGVWLFAVLCSYIRLSYWHRRFYCGFTTQLLSCTAFSWLLYDFFAMMLYYFLFFLIDILIIVLCEFLTLFSMHQVFSWVSCYWSCTSASENGTWHERSYFGHFWFL